MMDASVGDNVLHPYIWVMPGRYCLKYAFTFVWQNFVKFIAAKELTMNKDILPKTCILVY